MISCPCVILSSLRLGTLRIIHKHLARMTILVAGGAGFLGSNFAAYFAARGHTVVVLDNLSTGTAAAVQGVGSPLVTFVEGSICDEGLVGRLARAYQFDRIYNFACPTGVPNIASHRLGEQMLDACTRGVCTLLALARQHRALFFHASSAEVYGEPEVTPQRESYTGNVDPVGFRAPYEEGKRVAETYVRLFAEKYGVDVRIARFFNAYGPGFGLADTRVIARFIRQALEGSPLSMHGTGSQERTFCFVSDVIAGVELLMRSGVSGEVYNLGGAKAISVRSFADEVLRQTRSVGVILSVPRPAHDHSTRLPDTAKMRALGWRPRVGLARGLALTITDFKRRLAAEQQPSRSYRSVYE